ncbi:hypothetical protein DL93DRAFT_415295 [Clavulina sp. PMI_390]|nr:hypothetical protein DL93DRAFT_415295 [Clavulina sp. PMI_390]
MHELLPPLERASSSYKSPYLGDLLVGVILNSFWTGVMHVQTYTLHQKFPNDPWNIKIIVVVLWLSQTFYFFSCLFMIYNTLILTLVAQNPLEVPIWEIRWLAPHKTIVTAVYQIFFAMRLWSYDRDLRMIIPLGGLILTTLGLSIMGCIHVWQILPLASTSYFWWEQSACYALIVAIDLFISSYLVFLMLRKKNGFKSTNSIIHLILLFGVTTGAVSSIFAVVGLISNQVGWFRGIIATSVWSPVIMVCAVLANLHLRSALRARMMPDESIPPPSFSLRILSGRPPAPSNHDTSKTTQASSSDASTRTQISPSIAPKPALMNDREVSGPGPSYSRPTASSSSPR